MTELACPRCGATRFSLRAVLEFVETVDVAGCAQFPVNPAGIETPDAVTVDATCQICRSCREVSDYDWTWE